MDIELEVESLKDSAEAEITATVGLKRTGTEICVKTLKATVVKVSEEEGVECTIGKNNTKAFISPFEMGRDFNAKEGDTITALVVGVNPETFTVNLSVKKYDQAQNRKVVAQYLKQAPRPTLGQLLEDSLQGEETEEK